MIRTDDGSPNTAAADNKIEEDGIVDNGINHFR